MKTNRTSRMKEALKAPTGIVGFDQITGGGLPRGRTTLLSGGPGSGKTVFALEFLANGARIDGEPGIFVAFEEASKRIMANAAGFGWDLSELQKQMLSFVDARPSPDLIQSGTFDLGGMLAALEAKSTQMKARRIVFDALDIVLALLPDAAARRREVFRLNAWLLERELTGIITAKGEGYEAIADNPRRIDSMQFMMDCSVILSQNVISGVSQRSLRVQKYRGSGFDENEQPFQISKKGFEVALVNMRERAAVEVSSERISSGVKRLDTMLDGGFFRGTSVLITGYSGTAKTTLGGTFAEAACRRGERTLFVSFDSDSNEVIRNLASVGIHLDHFERKGVLRMISARTISGSAEIYLARIKMLASEHEARCIVIDPVSVWSRSGNDLAALNVAERLIDWSKADGVSILFTSLFDEITSPELRSPLQLSTLVDTWIHLDYLVQAGERNRGLSIIKSRGTAHSNQVRELILSDEGVTLADVYSAGGEVLMGTLRWEKERAQRRANDAGAAAGDRARGRLDADAAQLEAQATSLRKQQTAKRAEKTLLSETQKRNKKEVITGRAHIRRLRGADTADSTGR